MKEDGLKLGADHYYATSDAETFKTLAGTFDLILCTVSAEIDWNAYLGLLKVDGSLVLLGIPENAVPVHAFSLVPGRIVKRKGLRKPLAKISLQVPGELPAVAVELGPERRGEVDVAPPARLGLGAHLVGQLELRHPRVSPPPGRTSAAPN